MRVLGIGASRELCEELRDYCGEEMRSLDVELQILQADEFQLSLLENLNQEEYGIIILHFFTTDVVPDGFRNTMSAWADRLVVSATNPVVISKIYQAGNTNPETCSWRSFLSEIEERVGLDIIWDYAEMRNLS